MSFTFRGKFNYKLKHFMSIDNFGISKNNRNIERKLPEITENCYSAPSER